jgi:hypothetical protein
MKFWPTYLLVRRIILIYNIAYCDISQFLCVHSHCVEDFISFILIYTQSIRLIGRVIGPLPGLYLNTR